MNAALHIKTTVLPGKRIEISAPELPEGEAVDLFLVLPQESASPAESQRPSALDIIASLQGHRLFQTPEEVDQYLQQERDSWDR
jgi:hypothetical protein